MRRSSKNLFNLPILHVVVLLLAGCLGDALSKDAGLGAKAGQLRSAAEEAARAGAPTTVPLAVFALEAGDPDRIRNEMAPPEWLLPFLGQKDPAPGDGRAGAWGFLFGHANASTGGVGHAEPHGAFLVIVDAAGTILSSGPPPKDLPVRSHGPLPAAWVVDSDGAAATVRGGDSPWSALVGQDGAYNFVQFVVHPDAGPAWLLQAGLPSAADHAAVGVDAEDGSVLRLGTRDPWAPASTEAGTLSGTAREGGGGPHPFRIERPGHKELEFVLDVRPQEGGGPLEFDAAGPAGQTFQFHWDGSGGTRQGWFQFAAPQTGDWTVKARLVSGTQQAYAVKWCALGASLCP